MYKLPSRRPTSIEIHMYDRGHARGGYMIAGINRPPVPEIEDLL